MRDVIVLLAVIVGASSSAPAWAAEEADGNRTAISAIGGLSVGSSPFGGGHFGFLRAGGFNGGDTGLAIGGGVARDLSPRFTVEATGLYLDRGVGAWAADAGVRLNILPSGAAIVPYFAISGGLYGQSSPDARGDGDDEFNGLRPRRPQGGRPGSDAGTRDSGSTDGMMTLGGGARFAIGPHVFVRPDARAQFVFAGDNRVLGLFTVNFGYRF